MTEFLLGAGIAVLALALIRYATKKPGIYEDHDWNGR